MAWPAPVNESWNLLTSGKIVEAFLNAHTALMGSWFYALMAFLAMLMIYMKTQNFGTTIVTGMIITAMMIQFLPAATHMMITIFIALGITVVLYLLFKR